MLDNMWGWPSLTDQLMYSIYFLHIYIGLIACNTVYDNEKIDRIALRRVHGADHSNFPFSSGASKGDVHAWIQFIHEICIPHDELMPLSCKGRQRGVTPPRGMLMTL
ncbi:alpha-1,2-Mannosidase [Dirofilaria immitis]|nr:alpha-1,2-Mannosidase [Dirofilaria immitis]